MALSTKIIKRRIKSIGNTKKITKAMEMISAVKMRRAVANVLSTRNYASLAWEMLQDIAKTTNINLHPLLTKRPVKRIGVILIASNRGLAGGFNSKILQETHKYIVSETGNNDVETEIIISGKQAKKIYHKFGHTVAAEFNKYDLTTKIEEILPIAQTVTNDFISGRYDKIVVAFTDYISAVNQVPHIKQILPLSTEEGMTDNKADAEEIFDEVLEKITEKEDESDETRESSSRLKNYFSKVSSASENAYLKMKITADSVSKKIQSGDLLEEGTYTFEPSPNTVLNILLPRLVEMQVYQAILESDASEHSARMMAMRNASDSAGDMIKELNYSFNKARQAGITREISEIVGGAAALE